MLRWIAGVLILLWLLGFFIGNLGNIIHAVLVIAGALFIFDLVTGNRGGP